MLGGKSWDEWIVQYSQSHQHPINRICHTIGIPLIAISLPLFLVALFVAGFVPFPDRSRRRDQVDVRRRPRNFRQQGVRGQDR